MDLKWDQGRSRHQGIEPQRDFLAEATNLALQLDPVSWDFDLTDRDENVDSQICNKQLYFNNTALATVRPIPPSPLSQADIDTVFIHTYQHCFQGLQVPDLTSSLPPVAR